MRGPAKALSFIFRENYKGYYEEKTTLQSKRRCFIMLQFLTIVGAVLVAMVTYTAIVLVYMRSKHYWKMVKKMTEKIYDVDNL